LCMGGVVDCNWISLIREKPYTIDLELGFFASELIKCLSRFFLS